MEMQTLTAGEVVGKEWGRQVRGGTVCKMLWSSFSLLSEHREEQGSSWGKIKVKI